MGSTGGLRAYGHGVVALAIAISWFSGIVVTALQVKTACIGNNMQCNGGFDAPATVDQTVEWLGVHWDGDKVRGISFKYFNNPYPIDVGDYNRASLVYTVSQITFVPDETLRSLAFKDSGYGDNSLRRIELTTSKDRSFVAGPEGFDHVVIVPGLTLTGTRLSGFYGLVNVDDFMQALGAYIKVDLNAVSASGLGVRTEFAGNNFQAWDVGGFEHQVDHSPVVCLGVRWDGDKVRGISFRLSSGQLFTEGDFSDQYTLSQITFHSDETLTSLTFRDSGYGHGSLRRIEMTTSMGQTFIAGPEGFDSAVSPPLPATGVKLIGFFGLVNVDNFMQAMGAIVEYQACSTAVVVPNDLSAPVTPLLSDLTGLESLCSAEITCDAATLPGNRRLLSGATTSPNRRILTDRITPIESNRIRRLFDATVDLWDLNTSDNARASARVYFTLPEDPNWHIDRQTTANIDHNPRDLRSRVRYNLFAVQYGGVMYASVLVPNEYFIGSDRIRQAFQQSQEMRMTRVLEPAGGFSLTWEEISRSSASARRLPAPPQTPPPPGIEDRRTGVYALAVIWMLVSRQAAGRGCP